MLMAVPLEPTAPLGTSLGGDATNYEQKYEILLKTVNSSSS